MTTLKKKSLILLLMIIALVGFASPAQAALTDGLQSYYDLNEPSGTIAHDSNLNGTTGTNVYATVNALGKISTSYRFDLNNASRIDLNNESRFDYITAASANWTTSFWFKTAQTGAVDHWIFSKLDGGANTGIWVYFDGGVIGKIRVTRMTTGANYERITTNNTFNDNTWHFALIKSTNGGIEVYVDDSNQAVTKTSSGTYTNGNNAIAPKIGNVGDNSGSFDGNIDEVGFWSRSLSTSEGTSLYNSGSGLTYPFSSPPIDVNIIFNVYQVDKNVHLTNVNVDWNNNAYDLNGASSPINQDVNKGNYTVTFSKTGFDSNTNFSVVADATKTYTIYLTPTHYPITTTDINSSWNNNTYVSFTCNPNGGSDCNTFYYAFVPPIANQAWEAPTIIFYPTVGTVLSTDGNYLVQYYSTNDDGVIEDIKSIYYPIDTTPPVSGATTLDDFTTFGSYIGGTGYITGNITSDTNSGVNPGSCQYLINNGSNPWGAAAYIDVNGTHGFCQYPDFVALNISAYNGQTINFNTRVRDYAGNQETGTATANYTVDTTAPTTTASGCTSGWHSTDQNILLTCTDALSDCNKTTYRVDLGAWQTANTLLLSTDGNHRVDYNSHDNVLNFNSIQTTYCAVDKTAPSVGTTNIVGFTTSGSYIKGTGSITATASDTTTSITSCQYTKDNGANWLAADLNATHCYKTGIAIVNGVTYDFNLRATNLASLTGTGTKSNTYIGDTLSPVTTYTSTDFGNAGGNVTINCTDAGSGCKSITYQFDSNGWLIIDGNKVDFNFTGSGTHNVYYYSTDNLDTNEALHSDSFYTSPDSIPPTLTFNLNKIYGFTTDYNVGYTMNCTDNSILPIDYNVYLNDTNHIFSSQDVNNTTRTEYVLLNPIQAATFTFSCTDNAGNITSRDSNTIYISYLRLINENTGAQLSSADINTFLIARAYTTDGNYKYDFNSIGSTSTYFVSPSTSIVFEFTYPDVLQTPLNRFIDFSLIADQNIGVCVPYPFQQLYEQRFISNQQLDVILKNNVANCYDLAGSLVYAYDVGYSQSLYTINKPYYLYYVNNGLDTFLSLIDGSKAASYNLDTIIFSRQQFTLSINLDGVGISPLLNSTTHKYDTNTIQIYYRNLYEDNTNLLMQIYLDSNAIWSYEESATPNDVLVNFDWSGIPGLNKDSNNLRLILTKTKSTGTTTSTTYFGLFGGIIDNPNTGSGTTVSKLHIFVAVASLLIFFFGLTIVAASRIFGFFGIILCAIAIIMCSYAWQVWYVQLLIAVYLTILFFIIIMGKQTATYAGLN